MADVAEQWLAWMKPMAWQAAILAGAVLILTLLARRASPRLRYALWCLVLVKFCLPPSLAFVTGIGTWLPRERMVAVSATVPQGVTDEALPEGGEPLASSTVSPTGPAPRAGSLTGASRPVLAPLLCSAWLVLP